MWAGLEVVVMSSGLISTIALVKASISAIKHSVKSNLGRRGSVGLRLPGNG